MSPTCSCPWGECPRVLVLQLLAPGAGKAHEYREEESVHSVPLTWLSGNKWDCPTTTWEFASRKPPKGQAIWNETKQEATNPYNWIQHLPSGNNRYLSTDLWTRRDLDPHYDLPLLRKKGWHLDPCTRLKVWVTKVASNDGEGPSSYML